MKFIRTLIGSVMVAAALLSSMCVLAQDGVTKSTIVLGQSLALTGPGSALAAPFHAGAKLYFDRVNAAGGINGRKIELLTLDDQGSPAVTADNTRKLLEHGVLALFGYYGSPQVTAAYPQIRNADALLFAPMSAADELRGAQYANIYSVRPGYSEEAAAITRHAETMGARKLAIIHAADGESLSALDAARRTMSGLGANLVAQAALSAGAAGKALAAKPESVLIIADTAGAARAVRELRDKGFRGPVYCFSNTGESLLAALLGPAGAGVMLVRVMPRSDNARIAVVRDLQADALSAGAGKVNIYMLEGYISARVFAEAVRRATPGLNRAKLKGSLESLEDLDVGGFRVDFGRDRVASKMVELSLIDSLGRVRE